MLAVYYLLNSGFAVFRSVSPTCFCDLITVKNGKTLKIEVRTGQLSFHNRLYFKTKLHSQDVDYFAIVWNGRVGFLRAKGIDKTSFDENDLMAIPN